MTRFFVPYSGTEPAAVFINGHRVILLAQDAEAFIDELDLVGADRVVQIKSGDSEASQKKVLEKLSRRVKGPIVVVPSDADVDMVLQSLEAELPWLN